MRLESSWAWLAFPLPPYARAGEVGERVLDWASLAGQETADAVFAYVHLMEPHTPYLSGAEPSFWQPRHHRPAYVAEPSRAWYGSSFPAGRSA